jgi:hypothetical protein
MNRRLWVLLLLIAALLPFLTGCRERVTPVTDQSSPRATLASLAYAIEHRDMQVLPRLFHTETPEQRAYANAMVDLLTASARLQERAQQRFGREDARQLAGTPGPGVDSLRRFEERDAQEIIENDHATLISSTGEVMRFQRREDVWLIVPGTWDEQQQVADTGEAAEIMARLARAMEEVADAIAAGQVTDVVEARRLISEFAMRLGQEHVRR